MSLNLNSLLADLEKDSGITKQASVTETTKPAVSAELASVLEKKASEDLTARAFSEGEALAKALLEKMAENNIIADNNAMVADDNTKVIPNPQGTVEQVLEGVVDNAKATGATSDDRVDGEGPHSNNVDPAGAAEAHGEEKTAADASAQTKERKTMQKLASDSALAKFIMEKIAQELSPDVTTAAAGVNTQAAPAPNKIQRDNAVMTAQDDAKVMGVGEPGGDGTVNALFESIVARAKAQGGQSDNLVIDNPFVAPRSDSPMMTGGPGPASEGQEKAAAVSMLVAEGMDFDFAVDLVKQAEEEILAESWEQEKQACLGLLMDEGVDFDTAVTLVKQAEEEMAKEAKAKISTDDVVKGYNDMNKKEFVDGVTSRAKKIGKGARALAGNKYARGGLAGAAVGAGAAALAMHHKKACVDALMEDGFDFDTAVTLVKQAEEEMAKEARAKISTDDVVKGYNDMNKKEFVDGVKSRAAKIGNGAKALAGNKYLRGGAAGAALGAGAAALAMREKKACLDMLLSEGIDFDTAVELTKQASVEIYGE